MTSRTSSRNCTKSNRGVRRPYMYRHLSLGIRLLVIIQFPDSVTMDCTPVGIATQCYCALG